MDYLQKFVSQFRLRIVGLLLISNLLVVADWWLVTEVFKLDDYWLGLTVAIVIVACLVLLPWIGAKYLTQPTKLIWQAILHIAPHSDERVGAPQPSKSSFGRDMVATLTAQLYQLAAVAENVTSVLEKQSADLNKNVVAGSLPLPLFVIDSNQNIVYANPAAASYIGVSQTDVAGKNFYSLLNMSFPNQDTLDAWLTEVRANTVTASRSWRRARLATQNAGKPLEFDLAAYYNKASAGGFELLLVLFDHAAEYSKDEQSFNFVAMTVHELRTPLTLLRGYVEALEEDLSSKLSQADSAYMQRIVAAGQQLAAFINNILNVARIEDDQFLVQIKEEQWPAVVDAAVNDMQLMADVRGITIKKEVAAGLPSAGVDRISIYEVLCNLLDNAIKYSGNGQTIILKSYTTPTGFIETTVQDFGVGIPDSVMPHLFEKFYRSHRTRDQIGGTGIGLYLCKTIVNAHDGNIWARSEEGKGSIFGFTILPYAKIKAAPEDPQGLTRTASGWIKNHSFYRR